MTLALFPSPVYTPPASIDLRCCGVDEVLASLAPDSVDLAFFDPPWEYDQRVGGNGPKVDEHYDCLPTATIIEHLSAVWPALRVGSRVVLWTTQSQLPGLCAWAARPDGGAYFGRLRWVTGGTWAKVGTDDTPGGRGAPGIGYHCLSSESEPWLLLLGPGPHARANVAGCYQQVRHRGRGEGHSEKPVAYQAEMVRKWTPDGGLVFDAYAGLGSVARACASEGRRYVGAEIDPERHSAALARLAAHISRNTR